MSNTKELGEEEEDVDASKKRLKGFLRLLVRSVVLIFYTMQLSCVVVVNGMNDDL